MNKYITEQEEREIVMAVYPEGAAGDYQAQLDGDYTANQLRALAVVLDELNKRTSMEGE